MVFGEYFLVVGEIQSLRDEADRDLEDLQKVLERGQDDPIEREENQDKEHD